MADSFIPKIALDYIKNKNLKTGFSYKDVWNEEHATGFTVAKAMQIDVLSDMKSAVEKAIEKGETFEQFKKNLKPTLIQKGWWGKKDMTDPLTGETVKAQLGSDRRLKTIYDTNIWSAYSKGSYDRAMESVFVKYFMYRIGYAQKHRAQHVAWDGLVLPKDDAFWDTHYPPNGYGCHCYVTTLTEERKQRYEKEGFPTPKMQDGSGGVNMPIKTVAPKASYKIYENTRRGTIERIPAGITPGFSWNQGQFGRGYGAAWAAAKKMQMLSESSSESLLKTIIDNQIYRSSFQSFVDAAFSGKHRGHEVAPVGFLNRDVVRWLRTNKNMNVGDNIVIGLESRLIKGIKATRHNIQKADAEILLDTMLNGKVYWLSDSNKNTAKDALIYLFPVDEKNWFRIAVRPQLEMKGITAPFVRSVGYLENSVVENLILQMAEIKAK